MEEGKLFLSVTVLYCHDYLNFFSRRSFFRLSRLRVVPHFSSGIVERAKRERAWKSPRVAFSRVG